MALGRFCSNINAVHLSTGAHQSHTHAPIEPCGDPISLFFRTRLCRWGLLLSIDNTTAVSIPFAMSVYRYARLHSAVMLKLILPCDAERMNNQGDVHQVSAKSVVISRGGGRRGGGGRCVPREHRALEGFLRKTHGISRHEVVTDDGCGVRQMSPPTLHHDRTGWQ